MHHLLLSTGTAEYTQRAGLEFRLSTAVDPVTYLGRGTNSTAGLRDGAIREQHFSCTA